MRHGEGLCQLCASYTTIGLFQHDEVGVHVKPAHIVADEYRSALTVGSQVQLRRRAFVEPSNVAHRDCGYRLLPLQRDDLSSNENFSWMDLCGSGAEGAVYVRLGLDEKLQAGIHRQLRNISDAYTSRELWRCGSSERSGFKLDVARRRKCGRSGYCWPGRVCLGNVGGGWVIIGLHYCHGY